MKNNVIINQWCFDSENKEFVKITNGVFNNGNFVPTEAIAIRVVSLNNGLPVLAFTYRKVNPDCLSSIKDGGQLEAILHTEKPKNYQFIGRV